MVVTDDDALYNRMLTLRDHGRRPGDVAFFNSEVAFKYKMSGLQAALGLAQLQRIEELVAGKRMIFRFYLERLAGIPGLRLNPERIGERNSAWMTTVVWDHRFDLSKEDLIAALGGRGIDTRPFFHPLSSIPAYADARDGPRARSENTVAYEIGPRGINLPSALSLVEEDIDRVVAVLSEELEAARLPDVVASL